MADEYNELIAQLDQVHAQGREAHRRFLAAQTRQNVAAMHLATGEHKALAAEARALVTQLRARFDAHFASLDHSDER